MPADERPLLRGRIEREEFFEATRGGDRTEIELPPRDPAKYRRRLLREIDAIGKLVASRPRDPEASRIVIAALPRDPELDLPGDRLADKRADARFVAVDPDSGVVVLDVEDPSLRYVRRKLDEFLDDTKIGKYGRKNAPLFALLEHLRVADHDELAGPEAGKLAADDDTAHWFEVGCRGGVRADASETQRSRLQMTRQFKASGIDQFEEYEATEQLVFFVRASVRQLREIAARVDCVYEYELAPPDVRDWLLGGHEPARRIATFALVPPPEDAPAVAVLDTGVATRHPMLERAIRQACSVVPHNLSPEDTHGHGTETAGIALYGDLGGAVDVGRFAATHWLESARLLVAPGTASTKARQRRYWPKRTLAAVVALENGAAVTRRAFCLTVTARMRKLQPTMWSHALDRIAYNDGRGRLLCVSAGNARVDDRHVLGGYPSLHLQQAVEDPAQAANVLTVGAFTRRTQLPPERVYAGNAALAPEGGVSPYTSAGTIDGLGRVDVVLEGGNLAPDGQLPGVGVETLSGLTTGREHTHRPLSLTWGTSEAAAHAARMAANIWRENPDLRPETVRGLIVHSASWTDAMISQFPRLDERMRICGYGVPDQAFARACAAERATVIVEDEMPNAVFERVVRKEPPKRETTDPTEEKTRRLAKFFRLPIPELSSFPDPDLPIELRVTLSYFGEPNTFRRRVYYGLELRWDMQGPQETEDAFRKRINKLARRGQRRTSKAKSFPWDVGITRRSRGSVQSDRWRGAASWLAGAKLLAVTPALGWWDRRTELRTLAQPFSLIVSVVAVGMDIYTPIETAITLPIEVDVRTDV